MTDLRESVRIITADGELTGHLFVGADRLPELSICTGAITCTYTPATFPANWTVCPTHAIAWGVLFDAWTDIEAVRQHIRDAQREAETDPCRQGDGHVSHDFIGDICMRCGKTDATPQPKDVHHG